MAGLLDTHPQRHLIVCAQGDETVFTNEFANPSGLSSASVRVRQALTKLGMLAGILDTQSDTIILPAVEQNRNLATLGLMKSLKHKNIKTLSILDNAD